MLGQLSVKLIQHYFKTQTSVKNRLQVSIVVGPPGDVEYTNYIFEDAEWTSTTVSFLLKARLGNCWHIIILVISLVIRDGGWTSSNGRHYFQLCINPLLQGIRSFLLWFSQEKPFLCMYCRLDTCRALFCIYLTWFCQVL